VCAPAGYGKTTLLSQWIADAATVDAAWVTLDAGDADPVRFWTYLVSALSEIAPLAGRRSLPALGRRPERLRTDVLPILIDELDQAARDLVLILEDYHLAECAPVAESLAFFADCQPARLQLVLSARSDPQLPLGRWRANDQLAEIRAEQLRFDEQEVAAFFSRAGIGRLSLAELGTLTARTEGWPAVLRLAAIILGAQGDRRDFVRAFAGSTRQVADYLATDVLQTVSPDLRAFLLRTSVLPRLCGPLCDAVSGGEASVPSCGASAAPECSSTRSAWTDAGTGITSCSPKRSVWNWRSPSRTWCPSYTLARRRGSRGKGTWNRRPSMP
jgi:LuxR family maltose regulon positive regulatory protein